MCKWFKIRLLYRGSKRWCPVCETASGKFADFGVIPRKDALCVHCESLERHRFVWIYFNTKTDLFDSKPGRVLHVAPELCMKLRLKEKLAKEYVTADLKDPNVNVQMDITDIKVADSSFDVIFCSHVLEHVPEDRKAMKEFYRILRPDGWAIFQVPIWRETTLEDTSLTDPDERQRLFGDSDHVRSYGRDFEDRLVEAGFRVQVISVQDLVDGVDALRMGLTGATGDIFFCTKA